MSQFTDFFNRFSFLVVQFSPFFLFSFLSSLPSITISASLSCTYIIAIPLDLYLALNDYLGNFSFIKHVYYASLPVCRNCPGMSVTMAYLFSLDSIVHYNIIVSIDAMGELISSFVVYSLCGLLPTNPIALIISLLGT